VADAEQPWLDLEPTDGIDALRAASIPYRIALGPHAGRRTLTLVDPRLAQPSAAEKPHTTNLQGFSLNAAVACDAHQRDRPERLCRYVTRPAIALDRLSGSLFGEVRLALKRPFWDGTTHLRFTTEDSWPGWPPWCRGRGRTGCATTESTRRTSPGDPTWCGGGCAAGSTKASAQAKGTREVGFLRSRGPGFATECQHHGSPAEVGAKPYRSKAASSYCRFGVLADVTDPAVLGRILELMPREGLPRAPPLAAGH
jgi:hypothetical protein